MKKSVARSATEAPKLYGIHHGDGRDGLCRHGSSRGRDIGRVISQRYGVDEETRTEFSSAVEFGFRLLAVSSLTYVYNTPKVAGYVVALFPLTRLKTSKTGDNDANVVRHDSYRTL